MNFGIKRRIQMGCGEPLQCCWLVVLSLRALPYGNPVTSGSTVQKRKAAVGSAIRCKS